MYKVVYKNGNGYKQAVFVHLLCAYDFAELKDGIVLNAGVRQ